MMQFKNKKRIGDAGRIREKEMTGDGVWRDQPFRGRGNSTAMVVDVVIEDEGVFLFDGLCFAIKCKECSLANVKGV